MSAWFLVPYVRTYETGETCQDVVLVSADDAPRARERVIDELVAESSRHVWGYSNDWGDAELADEDEGLWFISGPTHDGHQEDVTIEMHAVDRVTRHADLGEAKEQAALLYNRTTTLCVLGDEEES